MNVNTPALKDLFRKAFRIGASVNAEQVHGRDLRGVAIVKRHFNTITAENLLKWGNFHPGPDEFDFSTVDRFVAFGEENDMFVVGHTLVWHNLVPDWVFSHDGAAWDRDTVLGHMRQHIAAVMGRYKGRIHGWDVVNEALHDDGSLRVSPWLEAVGEDYVACAFRFAHEADPSAELYYNDYSLEHPPKRAGAVALVRRLLAEGIPIAGVGLQHHDKLDWPSIADVEATIEAFGSLGVKVMVTELDVDVLPSVVSHLGADIDTKIQPRPSLDPYQRALPAEVGQSLARRYADLFGAFLKHRDVISRVTFWTVSDGDSWLNYWPVLGRTAHPLLFDWQGEPKAAFFAVVEAAQAAAERAR